MNLKTINLNKFTKGSDIDRNNFVSDLGEAFETIGFAAIEGHDFTNKDLSLIHI